MIGWDCGVRVSPCSAGIGKCGDVSMTDKDIDNPAAWLIMNSFTNLHNVGYLAFLLQPVGYVVANIRIVLSEHVSCNERCGNLCL